MFYCFIVHKTTAPRLEYFRLFNFRFIVNNKWLPLAAISRFVRVFFSAIQTMQKCLNAVNKSGRKRPVVLSSKSSTELCSGAIFGLAKSCKSVKWRSLELALFEKIQSTIIGRFGHLHLNPIVHLPSGIKFARGKRNRFALSQKNLNLQMQCERKLYIWFIVIE